MTEPTNGPTPLRVRIAQAMATHPSLGGLYSDHPDSYLTPHKGATASYVTEADAVLAVVEAEIDRVARERDGEIEQMARELYAWRTGARRRTWPTVAAAPDGVAYAAYLARAQGTEGGEEHDRLLREAAQRMKALHDAAQTLLQEREVLSWLHAEAVWHAERLRVRVHEVVDETQRRFAPYQSRCDKFDVWSKWAREMYERVGGNWGSESEATRLVVHSLLQERDKALAALEKQQTLLAEFQAHNDDTDNEQFDLQGGKDLAEEWADKLAYAVAPVEVIGEHSGSNNPWANALGLLERCPVDETRVKLALALETLGAIWLYVKWRYVSKQLTTEQKELWADAVDAFGEPRDGKAERWWRDDFVEEHGRG